MAKVRPVAAMERDGLEKLLYVLAQQGFRVIGPTVQNSAVVYDDIASTADLPVGYTDRLDAGVYRLQKTNETSFFAYSLSPHSWKKFLFPPAIRLWQASRNGSEMQIHPFNGDAERFAFIGVRPCDLRAIAVQDRVFLSPLYADPIYRKRRESAFIVVVNCVRPGGTCFCASMNTGPKAEAGFDLALTEVYEPERHFFVVDVGSQRGEAVLNDLPHRPVTPEEQQTARRLLQAAAEHMGRSLDTKGLPERLSRNSEHPHWDEVAARCLACGNCTLVCPTCFCTTVEDVTDLTGEHAEHWRKWDSCFSLDFSYIFGGSIRASAKSRYRQWMTHKLSAWVDQFGTMGCVGCGRCISWCPVGIDITEEARAIQDAEPARAKRQKQG